jgi:glycine hydroxymethyltransferase
MLKHDQIPQWIKEHEAWRGQCMNLIASENALSPAVRQALDNDLVQRYGNYLGRDLSNRRYSGSRFIQEIEIGLEEIIQVVFGVTEVELRAISGHVAGLAVIMATCNPGDTVLEITGADGGHGLAIKAVQSPLIDLDVKSIPFDPISFNIDVQATRKLIRETKPSLVILGSSNFLFPNPVNELAAFLSDYPDIVLAYDASHVFGLIACKTFQDPIKEGAHVVFGSTHKTLPGPQGGLIISNSPKLMDAISVAVYPGAVTNHHLMRSPALAISLLEMLQYPGYGQKVISNAQSLGRGLAERGIPVIAPESNFTKSHTILIPTSAYGTGAEVARRLETADIMCSYTKLPDHYGTQGIRMGTSEVTRLGATETNMDEAAEIISKILLGEMVPTAAHDHVHAWAMRLPGIQYA